MTCPGPLTLTIHLQTRRGDAYDGDRLALAYDVRRRRQPGAARPGRRRGATIQLDEPSYSIIPGQAAEWIALYNTAVRGVRERGVRLGLHVCFGNLGSRPRGRRRYRWMFPDLLEADADEIVLEFANREMIEVDLLGEIVRGGKDAGAGVVDVKSFWVEPAEEVAERVRECLQHVPPERLTLLPDCGFFQLPRWLCAQKLQAARRRSADRPPGAGGLRWAAPGAPGPRRARRAAPGGRPARRRRAAALGRPGRP